MLLLYMEDPCGLMIIDPLSEVLEASMRTCNTGDLEDYLFLLVLTCMNPSCLLFDVLL